MKESLLWGEIVVVGNLIQRKMLNYMWASKKNVTCDHVISYVKILI